MQIRTKVDESECRWLIFSLYMIILGGRKISKHWMLFLITTYGSLQRDTCKVGQVVSCPVKKTLSNSLVKVTTHSCLGELWICFVLLPLSTSSFVALCVLPQRPRLLQLYLPFSLPEDCLEVHKLPKLSLSNGPVICRVLIVTCRTKMKSSNWPFKNVVKLSWLVTVKSIEGEKNILKC